MFESNYYLQFVKTLFLALWNKLDLSLDFLIKGLKWLYNNPLTTGIAASVIGVLFAYKKMSKTTTPQSKSIPKHLIAQSARHIASAVSIMQKEPLLAYEHALHASISANTAKDLIDDKSSFSKELGVDIYAYLEYVNSVVTQTKNKLTR